MTSVADPVREQYLALLGFSDGDGAAYSTTQLVRLYENQQILAGVNATVKKGEPDVNLNKFPFPSGSGSYGFNLVVTLDGSKVYAVDYQNGKVIPFDVVTSVFGDPITVGASPDGIAISPDGKTVYVANGSDNTVSVIDVETDTVVGTVSVDPTPYGIAVSPDNSTAWAACFTTGTVVPIDRETLTAGTPIVVDATNGVAGITAAPDGKTVWVAGSTLVTANSAVYPIDVDTLTVGTAIDVADYLGDLIITPDGKTLYVLGVSNGNYVYPIDVETKVVSDPIIGLRLSGGNSNISVMACISKLLYVPDGNSYIMVIDIASNELIANIPDPNVPYGAGSSLDGSVVFVTEGGSSPGVPSIARIVRPAFYLP